MKKQGLIAVFMFVLVLTFAACSGNDTKSQASSGAASSSATVSSSEAASQAEGSTKAEAKNIKFSVVSGDDTETFNITTDAENLRAALEQEGLITGDESEFGLFVTSVNGIAANADKQEWWCLTKDGEMWSYGVDDTEISDGDIFEFTLTEGY